MSVDGITSNCDMDSQMDTEAEGFEDDPRELYGIRDGTLFVIDATKPMFQMNSNDKVPYFVQCIELYINILSQKLVWNKQDWMGLVLFGTEKWDMEPEIKNILTLQELKLVSIEYLKDAIELSKEKWKDYESIASSTAYPLHDVLWHAAQAFSSIKITMPIKKVILFTCQDNPPITDNNEKNRIRVKTASYSDIELQLFVVGLGDTWNHENFYQDLEMLSRKIDKEDYKRTSLNDLIEQVKLPSRSMAKLPWRIGEGVTLDISVRSLSVKAKYLQKVRMSKESNVPLTSCTRYKRANSDELQEEVDEDETGKIELPVLASEIRKTQKYGGRIIYFTSEEIRSLSNIKQPGIDIIGVKPIHYDPLYHFEAPYFVTYNKSLRKDNKLLFGALLNKCEAKGLMIICCVTIRKYSPSNLYCMIPNVKDGGFYLYKIPFKEYVRNLNEHLKKYIYDDNNNKPPTDSESIDLLANMIKKLETEYDPKLFPNPKLQVQRQNIETLALDSEEREQSRDQTVPDNNAMKEKVRDLVNQIKSMCPQKREIEENNLSKKRVKESNNVPTEKANIEDDMHECIKNHELDSCKIPQLKDFLKSVGLKVSGTKKELINRIYEHCGENS